MRLLKNIGLYTASSFIQQGVAVVLLPLLTYHLTPHDYGITSGVSTVQVTIAIVFGLSLQASVRRFYPAYEDTEPERLRRILGSALFVVLVSCAACVGLAALCAAVAPDVMPGIPFTPYLWLAVAIATTTILQNQYLSGLHAQQQGARAATFSLVTFAARISLTLVAVIGLRWGALGVIVANAAVSVFAGAFGLFSMLRQFPLSADRAALRQNLAYALPLLPHVAAGYVLDSADRWIVNGILGTTALGLYHVGYQFGNLVTLTCVSASVAYAPWLQKRLDSGGSPHEVGRTGEALGLLLFLVATGMCLGAPEIVFVLTSPKFHASAGIVALVAAGGAWHAVYYVTSAPVMGVSPWAVSRVTLSTALVDVSANLLFVRYFGLLGGGFAAITSRAVLGLAMFYSVRITSVRFRASRLLLPPLLLSATAPFVTMLPFALRFSLGVVVAALAALLERERVAAVLSKLRKKGATAAPD